MASGDFYDIEDRVKHLGKSECTPQHVPYSQWGGRGAKACQVPHGRQAQARRRATVFDVGPTASLCWTAVPGFRGWHCPDWQARTTQEGIIERIAARNIAVPTCSWETRVHIYGADTRISCQWRKHLPKLGASAETFVWPVSWPILSRRGV